MIHPRLLLFPGRTKVRPVHVELAFLYPVSSSRVSTAALTQAKQCQPGEAVFLALGLRRGLPAFSRLPEEFPLTLQAIRLARSPLAR